ncbi:MAG: DUF1850 domain-containing protein [Defluviitaleaceae bacterium]|nr:DUF1850 domain-containing protein [Defluviitaleaceae bacterium]
MKNKKNQPVIIYHRLVFILIFLLVLVFAAFYQTPHIVISRPQGSGHLFTYRTYEGMEFFIDYIHSVNQGFVREFFKISNGGLIFTAIEFEEFGAGMPTEYAVIFLPDGGMRMEGFNRSVTDFSYIVGHTTNHAINIGQTRVYFTDLAEPGTGLSFGLRQLNFWGRL